MNAKGNIHLIIPTLNNRGLSFIENTVSMEDGFTITAVPVSKSIKSVTAALRKLIGEFPMADYVCTTAGILFDRRIWDPFYNFVAVYTPLLWWAKSRNPALKVIGYNVGVISSTRTLGRHILRKCIQLHDKIYLREEADTGLLRQLNYQGPLYKSADNIFGYRKPEILKKPDGKRKIFINLTLYGVKNRKNFIWEMVRFVTYLADAYDISFFQTSRRDLGVAKEVCKEAQIAEERIKFPEYTEYQKIQNMLSDCDILVGMRMHSLIFALKGCCPVVAISYSQKVMHMMQGMGLEKYTVSTDNLSICETLLSKLEDISDRQEDIVNHIYSEMEDRYRICNSLKKYSVTDTPQTPRKSSFRSDSALY